MAKREYHIVATTFDRRGRPIASASNDYRKTHPRQAQLAEQVGQPYRQSLHAEIAALIKSRRHEVHSITIERHDRHGQPRNAQPCPICQRALQLAGVKRVTYTVG